MTPAARINAAIDVMDRILAGEPADRCLAAWGRQNRYAGSKDRAAIADLVYDVLRRKRSLAALGGGESGRALLLGLMRDAKTDPDSVFGAPGYAPAALSDDEKSGGRQPHAHSSESADFPDWVWSALQASHGKDAQEIALQMRVRAKVHLRVNLALLDRESARQALAFEGVIARPSDLSPSALEVIEGARKIRHSQAYLEGKIELQDAASQAVSDMVPLEQGQKLLDFCAGGGGKSLAIAARVKAAIFAYDADPNRMKDLPQRATRAQALITCISLDQCRKQSPFDTVLVDVPCSGSGSWRRDPQGKWLLTQEKLVDLQRLQREVLDQTCTLVRAQGHLVYVTCSVLTCENSQQVDDFLVAHKDFSLVEQKAFTPLDGGDGFYCAVLQRT